MARKKPRALTLLQRRFVAEYARDGNGTRAALRAGYRGPSARKTAFRMLRRADIQDAIEEARARAKDAISLDRVYQEMARIAFADMRNYTVIGEDGKARIKASKLMSDDEAAAIAEVFTDEKGLARIRLYEKRGLLQLLASSLAKRPPTPPPEASGPEAGLSAREILRRRLNELVAREKERENARREASAGDQPPAARDDRAADRVFVENKPLAN